MEDGVSSYSEAEVVVVEVGVQGHEQQEPKSLGAGEVEYIVDLAGPEPVYRRDGCVHALLEVRCASYLA